MGRSFDALTYGGGLLSGIILTVAVFQGAVWFKDRRRDSCADSERKRTNSSNSDSHWIERQVQRPKRVILVRHGESESNINRQITAVVPDYDLHLTQKGRQQALSAGERLRAFIGNGTVSFLVSPYIRTRETFLGIARAWGGPEKVTYREELLIREQDFGNFDKSNIADCHVEKKIYGSFFYRFPEGESPTDVYNRASLFLESLYRRWETHREENLVVVSHGVFLLVFLMRLFRYSHDDYYTFELMKNCEFVVLERPETGFYFNISFSWTPDGVMHHGGLRLKPEGKAEKTKTPIWTGDPDAPPIESSPLKQ